MVVGYSLFLVGLVGVVIGVGSIIRVLMGLELMLLGGVVNMVISGLLLDDVFGLQFGIVILSVAATESALGLGVLISYFRVCGSISFSSLNLLQR